MRRSCCTRSSTSEAKSGVLKGRILFFRVAADAQVTGARFEEPLSPLAHLRDRLLLLRLEVGEVREAKRAGDGMQMKFDVILPVRLEHLKDVAAELLPRRATEPV